MGDGRGREVLVTGANEGIGQAIALSLAEAGFVVTGTARTAEKQRSIRDAARRAGVVVRTARLDVDDADQGARLVDELRPWGLVNNAGYIRAGEVGEVGDDDARDQLETLLVGPVRLARAAARHMAAEGDGRIVNISSIAAEISSPLLGWYQAAKRALEGVSDAMRMELAPQGVRVVLVQPGMVRTGIWDDAREQLQRGGGRRGPAAAFRHLSWALEPVMSSPEAVASTVRHTLTTSSPRDRYPVGVDAQLLTRVARVAPAWVTDVAARALLNFT